MAGTLFIVPTPLGNLKDLSPRALETLQIVDRVACEDTRRTLALLTANGVRKSVVSYHAHSGPGKETAIVEALLKGENVALVSDAGTPAISDPGSILVDKALKEGIRVEAIPGPCAAVTALSASGFPADQFLFLGFLPRRAIRQSREFEKVKAAGVTGVFYESPFRTVDTLETLRKTLGDQTRVVVARELTKKFEEYVRGTAAEVLEQLKGREIKGEVTIVFNPEQGEPS